MLFSAVPNYRSKELNFICFSIESPFSPTPPKWLFFLSFLITYGFIPWTPGIHDSSTGKDSEQNFGKSVGGFVHRLQEYTRTHKNVCVYIPQKAKIHTWKRCPESQVQGSAL